MGMIRLMDKILRICFQFLVCFARLTNQKFRQLWKNIITLFPKFPFKKDTVRRWYKRLTNFSLIFEPKGKPGPHFNLGLAVKLEHLLQEDNTQSQRELAAKTGVDHRTVGRYLNILEFFPRMKQVIPYKLTPERRRKRIFYAKVMLAILKESSAIGYKNIITGDESYFLYNYPRRRVYVRKGTSTGTIVRSSIQCKKTLMTVFLSGAGKVLLKESPKGQYMTTRHFITDILTDLNTWWHETQQTIDPELYTTVMNRCLDAAWKVILSESRNFERQAGLQVPPDEKVAEQIVSKISIIIQDDFDEDDEVIDIESTVPEAPEREQADTSEEESIEQNEEEIFRELDDLLADPEQEDEDETEEEVEEKEKHQAMIETELEGNDATIESAGAPDGPLSDTEAIHSEGIEMGPSSSSVSSITGPPPQSTISEQPTSDAEAGPSSSSQQSTTPEPAQPRYSFRNRTVEQLTGKYDSYFKIQATPKPKPKAPRKSAKKVDSSSPPEPSTNSAPQTTSSSITQELLETIELLRLFVHFDNAPCHNSKLTKEFLQTLPFIRIPHPPYSPDLAPCDFYLFGFLKTRLKKLLKDEDVDMEDILNKTLLEVDEKVMQRVFENWQVRLQWVIDHNGDYCDITPKEKREYYEALDYLSHLPPHNPYASARQEETKSTPVKDEENLFSQEDLQQYGHLLNDPYRILRIRKTM